MQDWFIMDPDRIIWVALSAIFGVIILISFNRMFGLRSFSKLSGFDFAITVAFGSILGGVVMSENPSVLQGGIALLALFGVQSIFAFMRRRSDRFARLINNDARLVYRNGEFLEDQMKRAQITRSDIVAKMREANALRLEDVLAVVVETTGDISVLHKTGDGRKIDTVLMEDVLGWSNQV